MGFCLEFFLKKKYFTELWLHVYTDFYQPMWSTEVGPSWTFQLLAVIDTSCIVLLSPVGYLFLYKICGVIPFPLLSSSPPCFELASSADVFVEDCFYLSVEQVVGRSFCRNLSDGEAKD